MSSLLPFFERIAGRLLYSVRGHDAKLFTKTGAFAAHPRPTIPMSSPDYGQAPALLASAALRAEHSHDGGNGFPALAWTVPDELQREVDSWLVVVEDPDAPLPTPVVHGIYYGLGALKTTLDQRDLERLGQLDPNAAAGFRYGRNRPKTVWAGPRPVLGHGPHRYFFQLVAVRGVDWDGEGVKAEAGAMTREKLVAIIQGKVLGWGAWIGTFERR
jgi:hypothetical protein